MAVNAVRPCKFTGPSSPKAEGAREVGSIFQRLALATALHMPWQNGKPKAGIHSIIVRTRSDIEQVPRYLHYEKAYLDGELDLAFKDMTTWECRFITNPEHRNEAYTSPSPE